MKTIQKSGFGSLVEYIISSQSKNERIGVVAVTNCHSDRPLVAVNEVLNVQAQNKRSAADKTYHLIVSFRADENPGADILTTIESRICAGLGFGEHQRVSAVHHDTDNLHTFGKRETIGGHAQALLEALRARFEQGADDKEALITEIHQQLGDSVEKVLLIKASPS